MAEIFGAGIGFGATNAEDLAAAIAGTHAQIGDIINSSWTTLSSTMQKEWIGEDEVNAEGGLAEEVKRLYKVMGESINQAQEAIKTINNSWVDAIDQNKLMVNEAGVGSASAADSKIEVTLVEVEDYSKIGNVKVPELTFTKDTVRGLASAESPNQIGSALDTFTNTIKEETNTIFTQIDASLAFVGNGQDTAMETYKTNFATALGSVMDTCSNIKGEIQKLAQNVSEYATSTATAINSAESTADGSETSAQTMPPVF